MSRAIDKLPEPTEKSKKIKLVIASASRTGTLGLYSAVKTLGYTPYHMVEVIMRPGVSHSQSLIEGIRAEHNKFSGIKRYKKPEFDKWLADYDCLIEIASFMGMEALEAYAQDPDVKFILTERDPDRWATSFHATCGEVVKMATSFPFSIAKHFDSELYHFLLLNQVIYWAFSDGTNPDDPRTKEALAENYARYIKMAKMTLPPERTCVIRLEDGLGWEQICPFLEQPIPDEPYPRGNEPEKFKEMVVGWVTPRVNGGLMKFGALVMPTIGALAWAGVKYGPCVLRAVWE